MVAAASTLCEVIHDYDLTSDIEAVDGRIPALYLHGDRDESAPLAPLRELASSQLGSTLRVCQIRVGLKYCVCNAGVACVG